MMITIRLFAARVYIQGKEQGPHLQAILFMPSGQELGRGSIFAGHSPSVQADAVGESSAWIRKHRPGWDIETLPGEGVLSLTDTILSARVASRTRIAAGYEPCVDHWHCDPALVAHACDKPDRTKPCPSCAVLPR